MEATTKGRLLRGAIAAVLACGLMLPVGALADDDAGGEVSQATFLTEPDDKASPEMPDAEAEAPSDGGSLLATSLSALLLATQQVAGETAASPTAESAAPAEVPAAAPAAAPPGYTHPADACAITVTGGTEGVDYYYENVTYVRTSATGTTATGGATSISHPIKKLVICSSKPLTLTTGNATDVDGTIWIAPGTQADVTLDNVDLRSNVPLHIERNVGAGDATADPKTSLHLTIADDSVNNLEAIPGGYSPGIHCGEGTSLTIDDAVRNIDTAGNPITPQNGLIPVGTTFADGTGAPHTVTGKNGDDSLSLLDSPHRGTLNVYGGHKAAAIGSTSFENTGTMIFNGGVIDVYGFETAADNAAGGPLGVAAGIGSGEGGNGTLMIFNGGDITSRGSYHGAAIGSGLSAWVGSGYGQANAYLFRDAKHSGKKENTNSVGDNTNTVIAGTIIVNGGTIKPIAPVHGNAIGKGCVAWNKGGAIIITGGTVLPDSTKCARGFVDIGGSQGYVIVTGGSVKTTEDGSKFENKDAYGYAYGTYSHDDEGTLVVDEGENNKVFMITIDLGSEIAKRNKESNITDSNLDERITDWHLTVGGKDYPYGAPARFTEGKLYLWLPKSATTKEITVNLVYTDKKGKTQKIEPLFRDPNTSQNGTTLKRYIDFELPEDYLEKLTKYYDGTPFGTFDLAAQKPPLTGLVTDANGDRVSDGKELNDPTHVSYKYLRYDKRNGTPLGTESDITKPEDMPADVGVMKFTMDSDQYATKGSEFAASYWGHRATGWWEIKPTTSSVEIVEANWTNGKAGTIQHPADMELKVTARINRGAKDPAGKDNRETCKPPEGFVQLYMDGKKVGQPIELLFEDKAPAAATSSAGDDPVRAAAREATRPGQKNADRVMNAAGGGHTLFTYTFKPSDADFLVPDAKSDNLHIVSLQYLPSNDPDVAALKSTAPANYLASVNPADNPKEAPEAKVVIEPIDPKTGIGAEPGPGADPALPGPEASLDPKPTPDDPAADPDKAGDKTYGGSVSTTWDLPTEANPHPGRVVLSIMTDSSGPIEIVGEDGELFDADFERDPETREPVRNPDGSYRIVLDPKAVGAGKLTVKQEPNGAYTGTTWALDVTVRPNPKVAPTPKLAKTAKNLTHPDGPTQPGDRILYTVTASNAAAGSAWTQVMITDPLPACLTLDEGTLALDNPRAGIDGAKLAKAGSVGAGDTGKFALAADGTLTVPAGTVYGGAAATLTFECMVRTDLDFADGASVDLANIASAEGKRPNPDDPAGPDVPLDPDPGAKPGEGPAPVTPPAAPAGPGTVVPSDPDVRIAKAVENVADPAAKVTRPGDVLRYTITMENKGVASSCLVGAVIADPLPAGMEPVPGSIRLAVGGGEAAKVPDGAYDGASRTIAVTAGDLWGGQAAVLAFDVVVGEAALGADNANVALAHGTVPSTGPDSVPTDPKPGEPASPPTGKPVGATEGVEPPVLVGADPAEGDVTVEKTAENATSTDGKTRVGDTVRYRIVLKNGGPATSWMDAVIRDDVPAGLEPVSGSILMELPDGTELAVADAAYNDKTRRLSVAAGHLYGGQEVALSFEALVTEEAVGADIGNVAAALGMPPSRWDPDREFPEPGQPFDPAEGWEAFGEVREQVESPAAYPPGTNEKGGVIEGAADDTKTIKKVRLAQTGDALPGAFGIVAALALAAVTVLVLARRRLRRIR